MFKRSDRGSGIPFHDDNKYAKTPMGIHTKVTHLTGSDPPTNQ